MLASSGTRPWNYAIKKEWDNSSIVTALVIVGVDGGPIAAMCKDPSGKNGPNPLNLYCSVELKVTKHSGK